MRKLYLVLLTGILLVGITFPKKNDSKLEYIKTAKVLNIINSDMPKTVTVKSDRKIIRNTTADVVYDRGGLEYKQTEFIISFYTALPSENGGHKGINSQGDRLAQGMVASNYYSIGTKIYLEGMGIYTVSDRGSKRFNNPNRLDVFVAKNKGESNAQYKKRVYNMGLKKIMGYVID